MNNEELLTKIKNYEERILYLENELNETKNNLKNTQTTQKNTMKIIKKRLNKKLKNTKRRPIM